MNFDGTGNFQFDQNNLPPFISHFNYEVGNIFTYNCDNMSYYQEPKFFIPVTEKSLTDHVLKYANTKNIRLFSVANFKDDGTVDFLNGLSFKMAVDTVLKIRKQEKDNRAQIMAWMD